MLVAGFDGCAEGWIGAIWRGPETLPDAVLIKSLSDIEAELLPSPSVVAVDIPIGLLDVAVARGRDCDRFVRDMLGPRKSSVFSPPTRAALSAKGHAEACAINRATGPGAGGVSQQAFNIFPKIRDAESSIANSSWLRECIIEVHPEMCFRMMGDSPLQYRKRSVQGLELRRRLLRDNGFPDVQQFEVAARKLGASHDDALDACAATWSAWRRARGIAEYLPRDATGPDHSMRIWY